MQDSQSWGPEGAAGRAASGPWGGVLGLWKLPPGLCLTLCLTGLSAPSPRPHLPLSVAASPQRRPWVVLG